jgi:hypothetical protein
MGIRHLYWILTGPSFEVHIDDETKAFDTQLGARKSKLKLSILNLELGPKNAITITCYAYVAL